MRGDLCRFQFADIDFSSIAGADLRRFHSQEFCTRQLLLDNLRLQLAKKFFARLVSFFLNLLEFFLPRRGAGNQGEIITLSDVPLRASLAELFLDTGQRPRFTT
nr:hypothetical protein [Klebsiella aerogenes]